MAQKIQVYKNVNENSPVFGKYFVRPVYDDKYITTEDLADFMLEWAREFKPKAAHLLEDKEYLTKILNIGIFKVGVSSSPSDSFEGCGASNVKSCHVNFAPETEAVATGETAQGRRAVIIDGTATIVNYRAKVYSRTAVMLKNVRFELTKDPKGSGING